MTVDSEKSNENSVTENDGTSCDLPLETVLDCAPQDVDWKLAFERVSAYIAGHGGVYSRELVQHFMALMRTHEMIVLGGWTGTGKTTLCRLFAEAVGAELTLIDVPNEWKDKLALFGRFDPKTRQYYQTPFFEAVERARRSPDKLHLIVLEDLNRNGVPEGFLTELMNGLDDRTTPEVTFTVDPAVSRWRKALPKVAELRNLLNALASTTDKTLGKLRTRHANAAAAALGCDVSKLDETLAAMSIQAADTVEAFTDRFTIPNNVRIIGTMHIDYFWAVQEAFTTKLIDCVYMVRVETPHEVPAEMLCTGNGPAYPMSARCFGERAPYPAYDPNADIVVKLSHLNNIMLALEIIPTMRMMRQAVQYANLLADFTADPDAAFTNFLRSKYMSRMILDGEWGTTPSTIYPYEWMWQAIEDMVTVVEKISTNQRLIEECKILDFQTGHHICFVNYWAIGCGDCECDDRFGVPPKRIDSDWNE